MFFGFKGILYTIQKELPRRPVVGCGAFCGLGHGVNCVVASWMPGGGSSYGDEGAPNRKPSLRAYRFYE